jgi:hypothetical protein
MADERGGICRLPGRRGELAGIEKECSPRQSKVAQTPFAGPADGALARGRRADPCILYPCPIRTL